MNCKKCNSSIDEDSSFCKNCGTSSKNWHLSSFVIKTIVIVGAFIIVLGSAATIYILSNNAIKNNEQNQIIQSSLLAAENEKRQEFISEINQIRKHVDIIQNLNELYFSEFGKLDEWMNNAVIVDNKKVNDYEEAEYFLDYVLDTVQPARDEYLLSEKFFKNSFSTKYSEVKEYYDIARDLYMTFHTEYYLGENEFEYSVDQYYKIINDKYDAVNLVYQQCQNWYETNTSK